MPQCLVPHSSPLKSCDASEPLTLEIESSLPVESNEVAVAELIVAEAVRVETALESTGDRGDRGTRSCAHVTDETGAVADDVQPLRRTRRRRRSNYPRGW